MTRTGHTLVICGIDTDVGKSYATGLLGRYLLDQGWSATTLKLVQTGCTAFSEDIRLHRKLMGQTMTDADSQGVTCPYVLPYPASPLLAARMTGTTIDPTVLDASISALEQQYDWLLVEGAGGLMVPLNNDLLLLDYLAAKQYPLILVTSPRLGSINHTRLSLEAIKARNLPLLGLVYNLFGNHPREIVQDTLSECRKALAAYGMTERIVIMPDMKESTAAGWNLLIQTMLHDRP